MPRRICIVEDDESIRDILNIILTRAGYEIEAFSNGSGILENHYELPDLFLLDKQLPGIDGISICKYLKGNRSTREIPVIIMSAFTDIEKLCIQAGANGFIEKPFQTETLLSTVANQTQTRATKIPT